MTHTFSPIEVTSSSDRQQLRISLDHQVWQARHQVTATGGRILDWEGPALNREASHRVLDSLFYTLDSRQIELTNGTCEFFDTCHPAWEETEGGKALFRSDFYQIREYWLDKALWPILPDRIVQTGDIRHPRRPTVENQILYRRFAPGLGKTITLRQATVEEDSERFHRWQNSLGLQSSGSTPGAASASTPCWMSAGQTRTPHHLFWKPTVRLLAILKPTMQWKTD
ncbi:hypothetical protein [Marinobacter sp. AC-23]|uniref:hypothetical protein n=1 Tax=Marinobacter sp. AC-23 TaxID=1879031 RepID=UPI0020C84122|nr:hypothetical protein [Marinobacter sp. AC-23]